MHIAGVTTLPPVINPNGMKVFPITLHNTITPERCRRPDKVAVIIFNEPGRNEKFVTSFPEPGARLQISTDGGTQPAWAPSGAELLYRNDTKMMVVDIATEPELTPTNPRLLFEGRYHQASPYGRNYDIAPDGQRFIMVKTAEPEAVPTQVHIVTNWFEEVKRVVPSN